jgi:2'-5' RNA ligase
MSAPLNYVPLPMTGDVAVVSYLNNAMGEYLASLMRGLAPASPLRRPHITLFPHRALAHDDGEIVQRLRRAAPAFRPVRVRLGEVATFLPVSTVVYLKVETGVSELERMHDVLIDTYGARELAERFAYQPHLTLAYDLPREEIERLATAFDESWKGYDGAREFVLEELTVVRETGYCQWRDIGGARFAAR